MIAKLRGIVDSLGEDWVVIDVGGVGYLVFASAKTLGRLAQAGGKAELLIDTHVREDRIHLYGFWDAAEREWFRLLTTVQGVGSKVALALLSVMAPDELDLAIAAGDKAMLSRAQGVGARLAARLVTELKDKTAGLPVSRSAAPAGVAPAGGGGAFQDALSALVNLGYGRAEAHAALARICAGSDAVGASDLIKRALKELGREMSR